MADASTPQVHPAAELFPLMDGEDLAGLVEDIREHGLNEPIVRVSGLVIDGRNRLRACELAGVEPRFVEWDGRGGSPTSFVLSENLRRRHLTAGQRAFIANAARPLFKKEAELARERGNALGGRGGADKSPPILEVTSPAETAIRAAELAGVATSYVYEAARIEREAPELVPAIIAGEMSVEAGRKVIEARRKNNGEILKRTYVKDKHKELVKRANAVAQLNGKWTREMTDTLAPPEARKQLTILNKAAALLAEAIEACEYRADTPHTFLGR